jgi:hypothetical protein
MFRNIAVLAVIVLKGISLNERHPGGRTCND